LNTKSEYNANKHVGVMLMNKYNANKQSLQCTDNEYMHKNCWWEVFPQLQTIKISPCI